MLVLSVPKKVRMVLRWPKMMQAEPIPIIELDTLEFHPQGDLFAVDREVELVNMSEKRGH